MMQMKMSFGPTAMQTGAGQVWFNPTRDIAYAFPEYLKKAVELLCMPGEPLYANYLAEGGSDEELEAFITHLRKFQDAVLSPKNKTLADALTDSGYAEFTGEKLRVRRAFALAMYAVLYGAFFAGYRECSAGSECTVDMTHTLERKVRSPLRQWAYARLFRVLNWL